MKFFKKECLLIIISLLFTPPVHAQNLSGIETDQVTVLFDKSLEFAAREVTLIYPSVKKELEEALCWKVDFKPTVVLIRENDRFQLMAGHSSYVAYAVVDKKLIVIDYSRMNIQPFTLRVTLKHELCHLVLHHYIHDVHLPKWLDEGVAQWISDGIAEIMTGKRESVLRWAAITGRFIRLSSLSHHFPQNERDLILAYEQSKGLVEYIIANYGKNGVLNILEAMKDGHEAQEAIDMALMISTAELEQRWRNEQRTWFSLFSFLIGNIYTIIFFVSALLTIVIYIRVLIRKKRRFEEEEEDDYLYP
ncbi:MAG: hypothetical protein JW920_01035 [Deltaproteobacteria bacterium]|nr:hypothetical protein [Deltaproteobacteria bacterium]